MNNKGLIFGLIRFLLTLAFITAIFGAGIYAGRTFFTEECEHCDICLINTENSPFDYEYWFNNGSGISNDELNTTKFVEALESIYGSLELREYYG